MAPPTFKIQYGEIYSHVPVSVCTPTPNFKIQYGEIYSHLNQSIHPHHKVFKIQYGEIYRFVPVPLKIAISILKSSMERFIGLSNGLF